MFDRGVFFWIINLIVFISFREIVIYMGKNLIYFISIMIYIVVFNIRCFIREFNDSNIVIIIFIRCLFRMNKNFFDKFWFKSIINFKKDFIIIRVRI